MRSITQYQTYDGRVFSSEASALLHEQIIDDIREVMTPLDLPDDIKKPLSDGRGWYQHDLGTVIACRDGILNLCEKHGVGTWHDSFKKRGAEIHPLSIIGRILDDSGHPLGEAWNRFSRIDPQGREHQQCYFAYTAGPEKEHICLNP